MDDAVYRKLAEHLDHLPGGFAPSTTGADLRVLRRLFTPEEAALAVHLTLDREEPGVIAERAGLPLADAARRLAEMADKGLIFPAYAAEGSTRYQAAPFVVGIYEFQVNNLSNELVADLNEYWETQQRRKRPRTITQMRTIPIGKSIPLEMSVLPYERAEDLVRQHHRFAVAPCICRRSAKMTGEGCDAPEEACLVFGDWADYYVRTGRGRALGEAEVLDILRQADAHGLVLQPNNARAVSFICCCCSCCCGVLQAIQRFPRPSRVVVNAFIAAFDAALCTDCGVCMTRCRMEAITHENGHIRLNENRCIGCGLCITTCPSGALSLVRKPGVEVEGMPETIDDTWRVISDAMEAEKSGRGGA
ncbi:MAG: 4Fe-4S binding protein [Candidatus Eisenbacteria bacterium]|jgi:Fe-S-cluster-containing hydrogenase component 2|nr:4Fe-4S binding protein [Candidatus Eisenbacteria bacterium]